MEPGNPQQWNPPREQFGPVGRGPRPGPGPEPAWQPAPGGQHAPDGPAYGPGYGQDGPGYGQDGPGDPNAGYRPPPASGYPPAAFAPAPPRARTGLILLIAFLVELVLIAGLENQWVTKRVLRHVFGWNSEFARNLVTSVYTFSWRVSPPSHDSGHLWLSAILLDVTVFVVTVALIAAVIRGPVTFGRAFIGTWMSVVVATMIGGYVRAVVVDLPGSTPGQNRLSRTFFGVYSPGSGTFLAGLLLGFVVALISAVVAVTTRRRPNGSARGVAVAPEGGPPFFPPGPGLYPPAGGLGGGPSQPAAAPAEPSRSDDYATTQFPSLQKGDDASRGPLGVAGAGTPPSVKWPPAGPDDAEASRAASEGQTTALPRFPGGTEGATTQLPRQPTGSESPPDAPWSPAPPDEATETRAGAAQAGDARVDQSQTSEEQRTSAFPRPPDEEDLGEHPDHDWTGGHPER